MTSEPSPTVVSNGSGSGGGGMNVGAIVGGAPKNLDLKQSLDPTPHT